MDHDELSEFPDATSLERLDHALDETPVLQLIEAVSQQRLGISAFIEEAREILGHEGHVHVDVSQIFEEADRREVLVDDLLLTTKEMAFLCALSEATVVRYLETGAIPGFKLGSRWRCSLAYFREWVASRSGENVSASVCVHGMERAHWGGIDLTLRCPGPSGS